MIKKAILIIGLLIAGFIAAVFIWLFVFLPARILQPIYTLWMAVSCTASPTFESVTSGFPASSSAGLLRVDQKDSILYISVVLR